VADDVRLPDAQPLRRASAQTRRTEESYSRERRAGNSTTC
jgi:hypothetical protein